MRALVFPPVRLFSECIAAALQPCAEIDRAVAACAVAGLPGKVAELPADIKLLDVTGERALGEARMLASECPSVPIPLCWRSPCRSWPNASWSVPSARVGCLRWVGGRPPCEAVELAETAQVSNEPLRRRTPQSCRVLGHHRSTRGEAQCAPKLDFEADLARCVRRLRLSAGGNEAIAILHFSAKLQPYV
jgi:hypothetical protein